MRIAIYGGSFDPIHTGHAMVANYVSQYADVDEVWLMVSRQNPLKCGTSPVADDLRLRMAELVAKGCRGVRVSDFELSLPLPSYTYVTLCKLRERFPQHNFVLVVGSDNWQSISQWRDPDKIIREFGILIYPRPGYDAGMDLPDGVTILKGAPVALVSSTFVRNAVKDGMNVNYFVPNEVAEFISANNLYSN